MFRDQKLQELRSTRKTLFGILIFIAGLEAFHTVYDGFNGEGWMNSNAATCLVIVAYGALTHATYARRIKALEAMNLRPSA